jgi:hypothetical protein
LEPYGQTDITSAEKANQTFLVPFFMRTVVLLLFFSCEET